MIKHSAALAILVIASTPIAIRAQSEFPRVGLLYSTKERHSLTYRCEPPINSKLVCSFEQANVRPKSTFQELAKNIAQAKKEYSASNSFSRQECDNYRDMVAVLRGQKQAPKPDFLAAMTVIEKKDALEGGKALLAYCDKPNEDSFLQNIRISEEKNRRTCIVSVNSYSQTFRHLPVEGTNGSWVVESSPDGPCGIVQLTRFESEDLNLGNGKTSFWKYIARKAVTNPKATIGLNASCSGFDEGTYVYDWRPITHQLTCDYIEFSPL